MKVALIVDQMSEWRTAGGPVIWLQALDRVLPMYETTWHGEDITWDGWMKRDAAGAIAVVFYLLARERRVSPELINIADVVGTLGNGGAERRKSVEARLFELGHDPGDPQDEVTTRWRAACLDCTPPDPALLSDFAWEQAVIGTVLQNALGKALMPWGTYPLGRTRGNDVAETYTESDIRNAQHVLELMQGNAIHDRDARMVGEAIANISSGAGLVNTSIPTAIVTLITTAIEIGYASAVNDVRDNKIDGVGPIDPD